MIGTGVRFGNVFGSHIDNFDVVCPRCGSKAVFTSPYDYVQGDAAEKAAHDPRLKGVRWSRGFVIERFPDEFPWGDKNNPYTWRGPGLWGIVSCGHCPFRKKHLLAWPEDAFYRMEFSFGVLWAYTREHLVQIRNFIAEEKRKKYSRRLYRIPKDFLLVRNRVVVVDGIDEKLALPETRSGGKRAQKVSSKRKLDRKR